MLLIKQLSDIKKKLKTNGYENDTNQLFIPPSNYNFRITTKNAEHWCSKIFDDIKMKIK